jgi:predicted nucleic acid-binding protein
MERRRSFQTPMLAATADEHRLGVLHYDHDYDVIASHCGLTTRSVRIAPRGSMA